MSFLRAVGIGLLAVACAEAGAGASSALTPDQAQALAAAREFALGYVDKLPNFICSQVTDRNSFSQKMPVTVESRGRGSIALQQSGFGGSSDRVVERLTFFNQTENYEVVSVDGKPAKGVGHLELTGATSAGEFGTALRDIFDPASGTEFDWDRIATLRGHRAYVYKFRVPQERGIEVRDEKRATDVVAGYDGFVFVDEVTGDVLRMTSTLKLPPGFSITAAERSVDYDLVTIADKKYILPVHSEVMLQNEDSRFVNKIEFKDYRRFGAESMFHYDDQGAAGAP